MRKQISISNSMSHVWNRLRFGHYTEANRSRLRKHVHLFGTRPGQLPQQPQLPVYHLEASIFFAIFHCVGRVCHYLSTISKCLCHTTTSITISLGSHWLVLYASLQSQFFDLPLLHGLTFQSVIATTASPSRLSTKLLSTGRFHCVLMRCAWNKALAAAAANDHQVQFAYTGYACQLITTEEVVLVLDSLEIRLWGSLRSASRALQPPNAHIQLDQLPRRHATLPKQTVMLWLQLPMVDSWREQFARHQRLDLHESMRPFLSLAHFLGRGAPELLTTWPSPRIS